MFRPLQRNDPLSRSCSSQWRRVTGCGSSRQWDLLTTIWMKFCRCLIHQGSLPQRRFCRLLFQRTEQPAYLKLHVSHETLIRDGKYETTDPSSTSLTTNFLLHPATHVQYDSSEIIFPAQMYFWIHSRCKDEFFLCIISLRDSRYIFYTLICV